MKQKLLNLFYKDGLLLHKIGFVLGATLGILGGMLVSERADAYELVDISEEETDGETED